jgi:purine-cytosine permease-like protein
VSFQNIWPKVPRKLLSVIVAVIGTALAARLTMASYETFLFLLGSVFLPLFGVVAARYVLARGELDQTSARSTPSIALTFIAWTLGFAVYHWILPTGPTWWVDPVTDLAGTPLSAEVTWLPASIPAFATSFLAQAVVVALSRGREGPGI